MFINNYMAIPLIALILLILSMYSSINTYDIIYINGYLEGLKNKHNKRNKHIHIQQRYRHEET